MSETIGIEPEEIQDFAEMLQDYCTEKGKDDPLWLLALCIGFSQLLQEELGVASTKVFTSLDGAGGDDDITH
jgi:hypothetical protein